MVEQRQVITIATGKKLYTDLAVNLARSFFWWHPHSDIKFQIVTDVPDFLPNDLTGRVQLILIKPGELGEGFSPKLHLDKLVSDGQSLFIDSDCLIYGDLSSVFEKFKGHAVSVIGTYVSSGEWFGDIGSVCKKFNIPHFPKFNGGLYYLEKGQMASAVYKQARLLEPQYDEIGFIRLRNRPNDEVIMALAMQLHRQQPIAEDGTVMSDPQACPGNYIIDVVNGKALLENPAMPSPLHREWYPFHKVSPLIVHFLGYYTMHYPYRLDVYRLKYAAQKRLNWSVKAYGSLAIEYPERFKIFIKNMLRPLFHGVFGKRKIKQSPRV
jgi:hypothetical protein